MPSWSLTIRAILWKDHLFLILNIIIFFPQCQKHFRNGKLNVAQRRTQWVNQSYMCMCTSTCTCTCIFVRSCEILNVHAYAYVHVNIRQCSMVCTCHNRYGMYILLLVFVCWAKNNTFQTIWNGINLLAGTYESLEYGTLMRFPCTAIRFWKLPWVFEKYHNFKNTIEKWNF